jgi:hypothetical protein
MAMTSDELGALVDAEARIAIGFDSGKLAEQLRQWLAYDAETGRLTYKVRRGCMAAGKEAGWLMDCGYISVRVAGRTYLAHRVAWLLVHGEWPKGDIDHVNGVKTDNRLANLRDVTTSVNCQNQRRARRDNSTGYLGVSRYGRRRFIAQIGIKGRIRKLGVFDDPEIAHAEYLKAKRELHSGCMI